MATKQVKKAEEPKQFKREIKGELIFKEVNPRQVQFDFDRNPEILSNRNLDLARDCVPGDFTHQDYTVTGEYVITVTVTKK